MFVRKKNVLTTRKIIEGLLDLVKGFLAGVMSEEEWSQISGTVSDIISQTNKISKSDFMAVFKDAGIFTYASLNVFDKMVGSSYTSKDIEDIVEVTQEMLEDMKYVMEIYREGKKDKKGKSLVDSRTAESIKLALESAPGVIKKLKDKIK
jgi:hypothetical protein